MSFPHYLKHQNLMLFSDSNSINNYCSFDRCLWPFGHPCLVMLLKVHLAESRSNGTGYFCSQAATKHVNKFSSMWRWLLPSTSIKITLLFQSHIFLVFEVWLHMNNLCCPQCLTVWITAEVRNLQNFDRRWLQFVWTVHQLKLPGNHHIHPYNKKR